MNVPDQISFPEQHVVVMAHPYTLLQVEALAPVSVFLSQDDWFHIFLTGRYNFHPLVWIERQGDPGKRVTFLENQHAA